MDTFESWLLVASFDYGSAKILYKEKQYPSVIIYHCQQCVEKVLKALWLKHGLKIKYTHDLRELLGPLLEKETWLSEFVDGIIEMTMDIKRLRYPSDDQFTLDDAMPCMICCELLFQKAKALNS